MLGETRNSSWVSVSQHRRSAQNGAEKGDNFGKFVKSSAEFVKARARLNLIQRLRSGMHLIRKKQLGQEPCMKISRHQIWHQAVCVCERALSLHVCLSGFNTLNIFLQKQHVASLRSEIEYSAAPLVWCPFFQQSCEFGNDVPFSSTVAGKVWNL